jgi:hypothetical protein
VANHSRSSCITGAARSGDERENGAFEAANQDARSTEVVTGPRTCQMPLNDIAILAHFWESRQAKPAAGPGWMSALDPQHQRSLVAVAEGHDLADHIYCTRRIMAPLVRVAVIQEYH